MNIFLNPANPIYCIFLSPHPKSLTELPLHFLNTGIVFVPTCTYSGISFFSHDNSDRNIPQYIQHWYCRSEEAMSDFKSPSRDYNSFQLTVQMRLVHSYDFLKTTL